jgi:hypothetical protein
MFHGLFLLLLHSDGIGRALIGANTAAFAIIVVNFIMLVFDGYGIVRTNFPAHSAFLA